MDKTQLTPLAEIMVRSYLETGIYSHRFKADYNQPPTTMAKIQHLRAVAQTYLTNDSRYELCPDYLEYGKVQVIDRETQRSYLIRSSAAVAIEDLRIQPLLFDRGVLSSSVTMVIYTFHRSGLDLSVAGTRQQPGKQRLVRSGPATHVATWPYGINGPMPPPFDQGKTDPFDEVGGVEEDEGGEVG